MKAKIILTALSLALAAVSALPAAAQTVLPRPEPSFGGKLGRTTKESTPDFPQPMTAPAGAPNVLLILTDDVGFGASSTFGGPIPTPSYDEQLVVYVREKGEARSDGQAGLIALAPKGAKPGVLMADTVEVTIRVKAVDLKNHKATLEFPDGSTRTVAVRPDVKLSTTDIGREVVIQATQAIAVRVEKP